MLSTFSLLAILLSSTLPAHDFHVSLGRLKVEGNRAVLQIRLFQDDLELGLQTYYDEEDIQLNVDSQTDSLFIKYLNEKLVVKHNGQILEGWLAKSSEDVLHGHPVFQYSLIYQTDSAISSLEIDNQVLMEIFKDQQNVVSITHYPSEREKMYSLVQGDSIIKITF